MPANQEYLQQLLRCAAEHSCTHEFSSAALRLVRTSLACQLVAIVQARAGSWHTIAMAGRPHEYPRELLSEAADAEAIRAHGPWAAAPLPEQPQTRNMLLVRGDSLPHVATSQIADVADSLGLALALVRRKQAAWRQAEVADRLLEIVTDWQQTSDTDGFLTDLTTTARHLLDADAAAVYVWHREDRQLIACRHDGSEETVPADQGPVGRVIQSGEPQRVDASDSGDTATPQTPASATENSLAVPVQSPRGRLLGAFAVSRQRGRPIFSDEDQQVLSRMAVHAGRGLAASRRHQAVAPHGQPSPNGPGREVPMLGNSVEMRELRSAIERVAVTDLVVLLQGENGTGKDVAGRLIHELSLRRNQPFVAVNCAALTPTLLESELFGHEQGAFTDAHESRAGKFELASEGTLLLDEIADLPLGGQAKLLRVLDDHTIVRVGGSTPIPTSARVIAATNRNLAAMVAERTFREDLFFRLTVVTLQIAPLRDRKGDILPLATHFLDRFAQAAQRPPMRLSPGAQQQLLVHRWPGNVRELRNLMQRLAFLGTDDEVTAGELSQLLQPSASGPTDASSQNLAEATREFQADFIDQQVRAAGGNITVAAERLGLHRSNLYRKMRQLGMTSPSP